MSDDRIHILSTRELPASLIQEADAHDISIEVESFIETRSLVDGPLSQGISQLASQKLTAIFTSSNALSAVEGLVRKADWTIFCIGQETRRQAVMLFGEKNIAGVADSASELADIVAARMAPQRIGDKMVSPGGLVFFCGDQRRQELPQKLKAAGLSWLDVVVYETRQTPHKTRRVYEGIAFFSPSAVESFFSVNAIAPGTSLFAIGRTTASAIGNCCPNPVITSSRPDKAELVRVIIDHFQNNK